MSVESVVLVAGILVAVGVLIWWLRNPEDLDGVYGSKTVLLAFAVVALFLLIVLVSWLTGQRSPFPRPDR